MYVNHSERHPLQIYFYPTSNATYLVFDFTGHKMHSAYTFPTPTHLSTILRPFAIYSNPHPLAFPSQTHTTLYLILKIKHIRISLFYLLYCLLHYYYYYTVV